MKIHWDYLVLEKTLWLKFGLCILYRWLGIIKVVSIRRIVVAFRVVFISVSVIAAKEINSQSYSIAVLAEHTF